MRAMLFILPHHPLVEKELPLPTPLEGELLVRVEACGVCRTDLHIVEGELTAPLSPLILGHQIVGVVEEGPPPWRKGDRVGIPWLAKTCGTCSYCLEGRENLCDNALFTGYHVHGGFAEYTTCDARYAIALPPDIKPTLLAPLLCAGLIGFRAYQRIRNAKTIGFYGFGSSAHLLLQLAKAEGKEIFVFTKKGDKKGQELAKKMGATFAGDTAAPSPIALEGSIIFASAGELVPLALQSLRKGGSLVLAGIHMTDIPSFAYPLLFFEKSVTTVSHLTRKDSQEFFSLYHQYPLTPIVTEYPLSSANKALADLKQGKVKGSLVLNIGSES